MQVQNGHAEARTPSPRERLARLRVLVRRGMAYWKGSLLLLVVAATVALGVAVNVPRTYRSEATIVAKPRIRTDDRDESSTSPDQLARQSARLKDMLTTRSRLETAIKRFGLYPKTVASKTMLDAVEEMKPHVGFRSLEGAQYVVSFDGEDATTVQEVTQYLCSSLIDDYAAGGLDDLAREADFLAQEEQRSLAGLEDATQRLTVFLAEHPEFAVEAKQAATTPFGPSPTAGIPLLPKAARDLNGGGAGATAGAGDPELAALLRQRARLEGEARAALGAAHGVVAATATTKQLDDQIAQAQAEVEAAAKRVAETQSDLASKANLTEDHPDMRAARMAADAAARQLHEAKVKLATLQQLRASGATADPSQVPPEIADKLRGVDAQIAARQGQLARARVSSPIPPPAASVSGAPAPPANPATDAIVALETEWQRNLRAMNDARAHHDDVKMRTERAKLALEAARAQASERMAVVDPPYRPTHPAKGGRTNTALAGMALALLLAIGWATARVTLDDRVFDARDVEALGVAPLLGVIPKIAPARGRPPARPRQEEEVRFDAA